MSWNSLVQAFHSALIDELTERQPEPKPTLGLPRRGPGFSEPAGADRVLLAATAEMDAMEGRALVALAFEPSALQTVSASAPEVWSSWLGRVTGHEFRLRSIAARVSAPSEIAHGKSPPLVPGSLVWIPIGVGEGSCYLGFGV